MIGKGVGGLGAFRTINRLLQLTVTVDSVE